MANVTIVKLKIRRGSDAQRKTIVLDQGEVGYTLDTRRLFVGDGATEGGQSVGAKTVGPFNDKASLGPAAGESPGLQLGDIGYAESKLYTLTSTIYTNDLSGWAYIGPKPDGTFVDFVGGSGTDQNFLTIKKNPGAIDSQYMSQAVFGRGLLSSYNVTDGGTVEVGINTNYLELSASGVGGTTNIIAPKANSVTEREISPTIFDKGIFGGSGAGAGGFNKISLSVNTDQFQFDTNNKLEIKAFGNKSDGGSLSIPTRLWAGDSGQNLGTGLSLNSDNKLQAAFRGVGEGAPISLTDGLLSLKGGTSAAQEFPFLDTREGVITEIQSSIYDMVTAKGLSGNNAGDGIPIGSIVPHAAAFTKIPAGYLLCDGTDVSRTAYKALFDVIGSTYGSRLGTTFTLPNLTGGNVGLYGADAVATGANSNTPGGAGTSDTIYLSGTKASTYSSVDSVTTEFGLSATAVNFIIKALKDPLLNIFNGAPDQVSKGYLDNNGPQGGPVLENQVYECIDNSGERTLLSSAGFIRFGLSGTTRNTDEDYDKFAIPVFSW